MKENDGGTTCRSFSAAFPKVAHLFSEADKKTIKAQRKEAKALVGGSLYKCKGCGMDDPDNKRCTGCYLVWFCGKECQLEEWPTHKKECQEIRDQFCDVILTKETITGLNNISRQIFVQDNSKAPIKKHCKVKVQIPLGAISGGSSNPIFVSNKDKSLCGFLHKKDNQEAYEKLLKKD